MGTCRFVRVTNNDGVGVPVKGMPSKHVFDVSTAILCSNTAQSVHVYINMHRCMTCFHPSANRWRRFPVVAAVGIGGIKPIH